MKRILLSLGCAAAMCSASAQMMVAINDDNEMFIIPDPTMPSTVTTTIPVQGITAAQEIVGMDFRPATGDLYILVYSPLVGFAQLMTLAPNGATTNVGSPQLLPLGGGSVGFDFNPVVDRIRVVAANGANYRLNPNDGTITATDATLQYAPTDPNASAMPSVGAAAYSNSYIGAQSTTLYGYDETLNILVTQNPPNAGTLNTIGSSGVIVTSGNRLADMDIHTNPTTLASTAYLVANPTGGTGSNLYTINTSTGAATLVGPIGDGTMMVKDISMFIDRTLPAVTGQLMYGITKGTQNLISFDSDEPTFIRSMMGITGVTAGQRIVGMDMRPATMALYALGHDTLAGTYQLYTINTATAVATPVNATPILFPNQPGSGSMGFDFNPTVDRIRVTGSNGVNYRLNPNDGTIAATDVDLAYATGDPGAGTTPRVGTVAYTNSFKTATATILYGVDDTAGTLVRIDPPNNGTLNTVQSAVFVPNIGDMTTDMDIYYDSATQSNTTYLAANTGSGVNDVLHTVNLATGQVTAVGNIGYGIAVTDIAVTLDYYGTLGVENKYSNYTAINVYPNPVKDMLYIKTSEADLHYTITGVTGASLATGVVNAKAVDVSNLPAGVYLMRLTTADGAAYGTARFVKQ